MAGDSEARITEHDRGGLGLDDSRGGHRPGEHEHRHEREAHRDLVGDHRRRGPQRAEHRVAAGRRPSSQHDAVHTDGRDGQDEQHGDRHVGDLQIGLVAEHRHLTAQRDHRPRAECRDAGNDRRQAEDEAVRPLGLDNLLEDEFQPVTDGLEHTAGPRRVHDGTDAVLHLRQNATLEPHVDDGPRQQDDEEKDHLDQHEPPRVLSEWGYCERIHATPPLSTWTLSI